MSLPRKISRKNILDLPLMRYGGEIVLVDSLKKAKCALVELEKEKVLGFDTESKPAFKKGEAHDPSLVQFAGRGRVYLFQLAKIGGIEPIRNLLEAQNIVKVGVAVNHDIVHLRRIAQFEARNFYDLGVLSRRLGIDHTGLRNLAAIFLRKRISKGVQLSDWSQPELTDRQKEYAATDAWISRLLYFKMRAFE
jgi:ribonuclease D